MASPIQREHGLRAPGELCLDRAGSGVVTSLPGSCEHAAGRRPSRTLRTIQGVPIVREAVKAHCFTPTPTLPYELRLLDFESAMQDIYDFFFDVNSFLIGKGLPRLEETLRSANLSGTISDMITVSLAKHSRTLVQNRFHNGHPDLIVQGKYPQDSVKAGEHGVEIKSSTKKGGAIDTHGARSQWMCACVYEVDKVTEPARDRRPLRFTEVYLAHVDAEDFRKNNRGELGTRTATLHREGVKKLRDQWIYLDPSPVTP